MRRSFAISSIGVLLILLGAWEGIVPFVGPLFGFGMGHTAAWTWTDSAFVLNVLPGIATVIGGLIVMRSMGARAAWVGGLVALCGGIWGVLGPSTYQTPAFMQIMRSYGYYYAIGALIVAVAAFTLGRLSASRMAVRREIVAPARTPEATRAAIVAETVPRVGPVEQEQPQTTLRS